VTLVGIVSADGALHLPDFRAAGAHVPADRAGRRPRRRGDAPGRIVVQTWSPDHPRSCSRPSTTSRVLDRRIEAARRARYPPHGRLLRVLFED
jgi:primosomal protein N' (replication factor Y)